MAGTALIAGVGPGFCEAFAWKVAREGHPVGLFARSEDYLAEVAAGLRDAGYPATGVPTDVTDPSAVAEGVATIRDEHGPVSVLAHTASTPTSPGDATLDPGRFERAWQLYTAAGLHLYRAVRDDLRDQDGTMLFFGSAPTAGDVAYKSAKDAARGLARGLADEEGAAGVHVAHVTLDSPLHNPDVAGEAIDERGYVSLSGAVETCYHLIEQPERARTFELDLHATERATPR